MQVAAKYFDGRTARANPVVLRVEAGDLIIEDATQSARIPLAQVHIGERLGSAPQRLEFAAGACCEVADHDGLALLLGTAGYRPGLVDRMQREPKLVVLSLVAVLLFGLWVWKFGLPMTASVAAHQMPDSVVVSLSEHTLEFLDEHMLEPSTLPEARQRELTKQMQDFLHRGASQVDSLGVPVISEKLLFRHGGAVGPNAFALPDGTVVLLDELVELAKSDAEILAVLAHESGHVRHRHGLKLLTKSVIVGAVASWLWGDFSALFAAAPAALLNAEFSREYETEADHYAAHMLVASGRSPALLGDILQRMQAYAEGEQSPAESSKSEPEEAEPELAGAQDEKSWTDYLSSHPSTPERIAALQNWQPPSSQ